MQLPIIINNNNNAVRVGLLLGIANKGYEQRTDLAKHRKKLENHLQQHLSKSKSIKILLVKQDNAMWEDK